MEHSLLGWIWSNRGWAIALSPSPSPSLHLSFMHFRLFGHSVFFSFCSFTFQHFLLLYLPPKVFAIHLPYTHSRLSPLTLLFKG